MGELADFINNALRLYWPLPDAINDEGSSGDPGTGWCARKVLAPSTLLELPVSDNYSLCEKTISSPSESDSIIFVGLSSLCGMLSEARWILWQGQVRSRSSRAAKSLFSRHEAPDDCGVLPLEQDHISDGSGGFGACASTFNSNPFSVPSECAADSRS